MKELFETLKDPNWVWQFQNFFGIEKLKVIENNASNKRWISVEVRNDVSKTDIGSNGYSKRDDNILLYKVGH